MLILYRFSMENLLSFIEITQFQIYTRDKAELEHGSDLITFPDNIPVSEILEEKQDDDELVDLKIKAHNIYKKYIAVGSELEINISWDARSKLIDILEDLPSLISMDGIRMNDLFIIFDECKSEVWQLMMGSFFRFQSHSQPHQTESLTLDLGRLSDLEQIQGTNSATQQK